MTTEEKAKAYDEALEKTRIYRDNARIAEDYGAVARYENIFPELRESEDERIRNGLVKLLTVAGEAYVVNSTGIEKSSYLAYLKKQKDHFRDDTKMVEKQDYSGLNDLERSIHRGFLSAGVENVPVAIIKETANECKRIANENANAEWGEEDERILYNVIAYVGYAAGERGVKDDDFKEANEWLRNLRSHPSWKPSEEQMRCLCEVVDEAIRKHNESVSGYRPARVLKSLYEQLQKLGMKEEPEYYQHFDQDC